MSYQLVVLQVFLEKGSFRYRLSTCHWNHFVLFNQAYFNSFIDFISFFQFFSVFLFDISLFQKAVLLKKLYCRFLYDYVQCPLFLSFKNRVQYKLKRSCKITSMIYINYGIFRCLNIDASCCVLCIIYLVFATFKKLVVTVCNLF